MEFRKTVMINMYARQQKRHRCTEQSLGLCGRGRGWDDLGEGHLNMYNVIYEMNRQSRFNAWYRMLGAGALGWPRGMVRGGRWEGGLGWGTRVYPWRIHFNIWQNQYNIVKFKNKIKLKKNKVCLPNLCTFDFFHQTEKEEPSHMPRIGIFFRNVLLNEKDAKPS